MLKDKIAEMEEARKQDEKKMVNLQRTLEGKDLIIQQLMANHK